MPISEQELKALKTVFLPSGPTRVPYKPEPNRYDREATERKKRHRELGEYAYRMLEGIRKDYEKQIDRVWKPKIKLTISAFATAISNRDKVIKLVERDRAEAAAREAFLLSLVAASTMSFAGAYVEHIFLTKFKVKDPGRLAKGEIWGPDGVFRQESWPTRPRFSDFQRASFGSFTENVGQNLFQLAFPTPAPVGDILDWAAVHKMESEIENNIAESAKLILDRFDAVLTWLNDPSAEFGELWCAWAGNTEAARRAIGPHFTAVRDQWARTWKFFGTDPMAFSAERLADAFERGFWAFYIFDVTKKFKHLEKYTPDPGRVLREDLPPGGEDYGAMAVVDRAIVNRFLELNILTANTVAGIKQQVGRAAAGAPMPSVSVGATIDRFEELRDLKAWATKYLKQLPSDLSTRLIPPAKSRALPPVY